MCSDAYLHVSMYIDIFDEQTLVSFTAPTDHDAGRHEILP